MKRIPLSQTVYKAKHTSGWSNISYTETALCVSVVWTYTEGDEMDRDKELAELLLDRALSQSTRGVGSLHGSCYVSSSRLLVLLRLESARRDQDCTNCVRVESLVA